MELSDCKGVELGATPHGCTGSWGNDRQSGEITSKLVIPELSVFYPGTVFHSVDKVCVCDGGGAQIRAKAGLVRWLYGKNACYFIPKVLV